MVFRRTSARLVLIALLSALLLIATASVAFAATGEETMGLSELQTRLDASPTGSLFGYMKTVVKGSKIDTIQVEVLALTGDTPSDSLILFQSSDPKIVSYGGIVAGMSGSPIYVQDDEGAWKVIGALSYGDIFTLGGSGLATPIESMLQIKTDYAPRVEGLSKPVMMDGHLVNRVVVSAHPEKLSSAAASGAFVARPLSSVFIGGLRPGSAAYTHLSDALAKKGITVVKLEAGLSAGASNFSTPLVPGAAIGALVTRGDMWIGGLGTVTYADGDDVLAFGHPAYWDGSTSLYMTNAWISGVWPSTLEAYKLGYPTAIRGTITQDRGAGIMGRLGDLPEETPFTAEVTDTDSGKNATSAVWMSSQFVDNGQLYGAGGAACSIAGYKLFDQMTIPGSANTTATVVVSDGTHEYTVRIVGLYDSPYDIVYAMTEDTDYAINALVAVASDGLETPHIVSVDLEASVTADRRNAEIARVDALAPLHVGDNTVRVSLLAHGIVATQTVDTTVTIPYGTPLTGSLKASSPFDDSSYYYSDYYGGSDSGDPSAPSVPTRPTVAGTVDDLNATDPYNMVTVDFVPSSDNADDGSDDGSDVPPSSSDATTVTIETTATTPWVLSGSATSEVTEIDAEAEPATYGDEVYVDGEITGPTGPVDVSIYSVPLDDGPGVLLATGKATDMDGSLLFSIPVDGITGNTMLRVAVDGGLGYTPAEAFVDVSVNAQVSLHASPKTAWRGSWVIFTAGVAPRRATGSIHFQWYDKRHKKWRSLITKPIKHTSTAARATCMWRPLRGTWKVRAVYGGDWTIDGATSPSVTIRVR